MAREKREWMIAEQPMYPIQMGAVREKDGVRFTTVISYGKQGSLLLYEAGSEEATYEIPFPEAPILGKIHSMKVLGLPCQRYEYNYKIDGQTVPDAYAAQVYHNGDSIRCGFLHKKFDWEDEKRPSIPYDEAVMYHLHVRNYTMNRKSGVRKKGTFAGLEEKIPYLKELGINQIKLMPVYEFEETLKGNKKNCWGYEKGCYFAPKSSYASSKYADVEFKHMIRTCHQNGIEVLLDFWFAPGTSSKFIADCLLYWVQEYHVDGFHVIGADETVRLLAADPAFFGVKMLCVYYPEHSLTVEKGESKNAAEINDGFLVDARRILKGDEGALEHLVYRNRRNPADMAVVNYITNHDGFTLCDLVSYNQKHNEENQESGDDGSDYNFSWNCGVEGSTRKKQIVKLRERQKKNAVLMMMLAQGVPMLLGGDEFGNSQLGNNNPYCLDNEISWVSWNQYEGHKAFVNFVKNAIAFRKKHPILHMTKELALMDYHSYGYPDLSYHSENAWYGGFEYQSKKVGMMYCEKYSGMEELLYVAYNFHAEEQAFALPKLPEKWQWYKAIDTSEEESFPQEEALEQTRIFSVPSRTIVVLIGREA